MCEDLKGAAGSPNGRVLYREVSCFEAWLWALVVPPVVLYLVLFVAFVAKRNLPAAVGVGALFFLLTATLANFLRLVFEVTEDEVRFGFGVVRRRFPREAVLSCEPYELTFNNFLGYGIRLGRDGTVAYNTRNGPGIKMEIEGQKRPYVVSVRGVERICRILDAAREPRGAG